MSLNILITGSTGFIGGNIFEKFQIQKKFKVFTLNRIINNQLFDHQFKNIDVVIHCAGLAHKKNMKFNDYLRDNFNLTKKIFNLSKINGVSKFIFLSSISIDLIKNQNIDNDYANSKIQCEDYLFKNRDKSIKIYSLRLPLVYGKNIKGNLKNLIKYIKFNLPVPLRKNENEKLILSITNLTKCIFDILKDIYPEGTLYPADRDKKNIGQIVEYLIFLNDKKNFFFKTNEILLRTIFAILNKKKLIDSLLQETTSILDNNNKKILLNTQNIFEIDMKRAFDSVT